MLIARSMLTAGVMYAKGQARFLFGRAQSFSIDFSAEAGRTILYIMYTCMYMYAPKAFSIPSPT